MRVLLVDDNNSIREIFKKMLMDISCIKMVNECSDGSEVIQSLEENIVDVIFMDIVMKIMDGFEATQKIKQEYPKIKVIGFSSADHDFFIQKMKNCGADGFISKFDANQELIISELKRVGFDI